MIAFIDTSTIVKKYVKEPGSEKFSEFLEDVSEIVVAPSYLMELCSAVKRKTAGRGMKPEQAKWLLTEAKNDLRYFLLVKWSEELVHEGCRLIDRHGIKTLDAIQLGSALLSKPDVFLTSDERLYQVARKELKSLYFA